MLLPLREPLPRVEARLAWHADDTGVALRHVLRVSESALPTPRGVDQPQEGAASGEVEPTPRGALPG